MNNQPFKFNPLQLQTYLDQKEIVVATAQQIMKDFEMFGLTIQFSGDTTTAYTELHGQLVQQIEKLLAQSYSTLIGVLYRIDLSENDLKTGAAQLPNYNFTEAMAHMIIERELKKVLSRLYYK